MNIGIFDSGLGGLLITHSIIQTLPQYDLVYLGDTARVPYGNRSQEEIYTFTKQGLDYLFKQDCLLVIIACNTASAEALRKIQQEYLPAHYPDRHVLGVLIPAAEEAINKATSHKVGILGTEATVKSEAFVREVKKLDPKAQVYQEAAPSLVPMLENGVTDNLDHELDQYLAPLLAKNVDTIILGCTHYPYFKKQIRQKVGNAITVVCQDEIIPNKLENYLARHPDIEQKLSKRSQYSFRVTAVTVTASQLAEKLFGKKISLALVEL